MMTMRHDSPVTSDCHRRRGTTSSRRRFEKSLSSTACLQCNLLVVLWLAFAVVHGESIVGGGSTGEGSEAVTIADLNSKFERLSDRIESLTDKMEIFLAAADSHDGFLPQEDSPLPDPSLQEEQHANDQQSNPKNMQAPRSIEGDARGEGGKQKRRSSRSRGYWGGFDAAAWLAVGTFVHEVWLCLQHANILLNPLCQRLDRRYGVALLKRRMYWVIAGVLAAYWAREVVSMWMATPYVSPLTWKMIAASSVYHVGKISLISLDARRGWSPTMGIMRLLMDHWHLSSLKDLLLSAKRVVLQAFDTATHALIVRDMLSWDERFSGRELGLQSILLVVGAVWAVHAVANLVTRKSTATLVVEVAKGVVGAWGADGKESRRKLSGGGERGGGVFGALDGGSAEFACTSSCSHGHKRCEVCHLLTRDQPAALPSVVPPRRKRVD